MTYENKSNDKNNFSLHDCRAESAKWEDNELTFYFPSGIFFREYGEDWSNTGSAAVKFEVDFLREADFFLFAKSGEQVMREEYSIDMLAEKINSKEWELEFAYRYDGYEEILYTCRVWFDKEPYCYEAQLFIGAKNEVTFMWNKPE